MDRDHAREENQKSNFGNKFVWRDEPMLSFVLRPPSLEKRFRQLRACLFATSAGD